MINQNGFERFEETIEKKPQEISDHIAVEAVDGMEDLTVLVLAERERIKTGGKTGITGEFGRPLLINPEEILRHGTMR